MKKAQLGKLLEAVGQSAYGQKYQLVERLLKHEGNVMGKFYDNLQDLKHKAAVLNEARAGKPISEEVLKDYPDVAAYSLPRDSDGYKAAIRSLAIKALPSLGMDTPEQIKSYRYDAQYSKDPAERYVAADIADYMESYYKSQQEKSNQTMAKLGEGTGPTMSEMIAENKRVKAELAALEKAEKGPLTEAEKEAAAEAEEEAIRNKAEAEIDEGPIGQAIAKIENGDIETKAQIRTFIKKLERDGVLDDRDQSFLVLWIRNLLCKLINAHQHAHHRIVGLARVSQIARDDARTLRSLVAGVKLQHLLVKCRRTLHVLQASFDLSQEQHGSDVARLKLNDTLEAGTSLAQFIVAHGNLGTHEQRVRVG
jgi:hypothetical protein